MQNIEYLASKNKSGRIATIITVRLTLTEESSASEVDEFHKLCKKLKVRAMTVGQFNYNLNQ
jgi:hypothetical protein